LSVETHTREERNCSKFIVPLVYTNEPSPVLLEYTLSRDSMLAENSIQTRLGGIRLPTTIKQSDETLTDLGNLVAVEIHMRYGRVHVVASVDHLGVAVLPILTIGDGSVHLGFDLTHVCEVCEVCEVGSFDPYKIHESKGLGGDPVQLAELVRSY